MKAFLATAIFLIFAGVGRADINYLNNWNAGGEAPDADAIVQTFTATDNQITDASILLFDPNDGFAPFWTQAHAEIRGGLPGNFDGSSGNVLFSSPIINIGALPRVGTAIGAPMLQVKFSSLGFSPIPVVPGNVYSLLLIDYAASGGVNYLQHFASGSVSNDVYTHGTKFTHRPSYLSSGENFWSNQAYDDLAFAIGPAVVAPEPSSALLFCGAASVFACSRRRRSTFA